MKTSVGTKTGRVLLLALLIIVVGIKSCIVRAQSLEQQATFIKNSGREVQVKPNINVQVKATPLHSSINSAYEDIKPRLSPDGKRLYFSRPFHPSNTYGVNDPEDIWYSEFDENTKEWSDPVRLVGELNNGGPNYVNNISATGDTLILGNMYLKKGKMRAGLSYSVNVNGKWSTPENIITENDYNMSEHANGFVSLKNGVIIRSMKRTESLGERDLFVSFWDGKVASEPVNMGNIINTEFEESSPYLAPDNKTLYFASKGHHGYGGFDIYVTHRLDESWTNWSKPENLGPAVNGASDDEFFSITQCGKYAVFSKRISIHNVDLYRISMEELFNIPPTEKKKNGRMEAFASL